MSGTNGVLFNQQGLILASVVNRPSKTIKTPYVADILILDEEYALKNNLSLTDTYLCHTPALGCGGLVEKSKHIMVYPNLNPKSSTKFICYLGVYEDVNIGTQFVGVYPTSAEKIVENCLMNDKLNLLKIDKQRLKTQYTIGESRFDFHGFNTLNKEFILEVKSVPIARYIDDYDKNLKKVDYTKFNFNEKIALFPVGFQKKKYDVISERALKHLNHLQQLKQENSELLTYICYVIQRKDVKEFQASCIDPIYKQALKNASENGVQIITIVVDWNSKGDCIFITDTLKIVL